MRNLIGSELPIVERLRKMKGMGDYQLAALMDGVGPQAADEIERLQNALSDTNAALSVELSWVKRWHNQALENATEIKRLRDALLLARGRLLLANPDANTNDIDAALLTPNAK